MQHSSIAPAVELNMYVAVGRQVALIVHMFNLVEWPVNGVPSKS